MCLVFALKFLVGDSVARQERCLDRGAVHGECMLFEGTVQNDSFWYSGEVVVVR